MEQKTDYVSRRGYKKPGWRERDPMYLEYYRVQYPDWSEEQCKQAKRQYCKTINPNAIEFYITRYPDKTLEECEQMRQEHIRVRVSKRKSNIEYYRVNFPDLSPEEQEKMRLNYARSKNRTCIEYYRVNFPDLSPEEQEKMLQEKLKLRNEHRPDTHGENNPHHRSRTTLLKRKQTSPMCLEFYQLRYPDLSPEEQEKMWLEHKERRRTISKDKRNSCRCVERWLWLGYSEEEAKQKVTEVQNTFNLEKCIKKYGEEEGRKRFEERQSKWMNSLRKHFIEEGDGRSPQSSFASDMIKNICEQLNIPVPEKERYLTSKDGQRHYAYDFTYGKKIIEFNGDYWHCNPRIYGPEFYNKVGGYFAKDMWNKDKLKQECAEEHGYKVLSIWECDYRHDMKKEVQKCIDFLIND